MADVDEITGDPAVRNQLRELINGLGALVSSTQTLEQESEVARTLAPLAVQAQQAQQAQNSAALSKRASGSSLSASDFLDEDLQRPQLMFDGEQYVLRSGDRLAGKGLAAKDTDR